MNTLRTTIFLALLTGLFLVVGRALGGNSGMMLALIMAVVMNFGAYWFSDKMVLSMYNAQELGPHDAPELYGIVAHLAQRGNLPMPKVFIIDDDTPNAFATGRDPEHAAVAATTGLLRMLTREELTGVMAHELGHVINRDILIATISAAIAGAITTLANMAQWAAMFGSSQNNEENNGGGLGLLGGVVMMILAPMAAMLIQMAISRSREYGADAAGAELCGHPMWLATALNKLEIGNRQIPMQAADAHPTTAHLFIVNPLSGNTIAGLFSTHPPMADRIAKLRELAYPR